jgi:NAD-dependent protein deacetylases, SIR2 family
MRPAILLYNEYNEQVSATRKVMNYDIQSRPEVLIVVGTSLAIADLENFVYRLSDAVYAHSNGLVVWINRLPPPSNLKRPIQWDLAIQDNCEAVAQLVIDTLWSPSIPISLWGSDRHDQETLTKKRKPSASGRGDTSENSG